MTAPTRLAEGACAGDTMFVAAFASGAAGIIHLSVVPEHLADWWGYGVFFLVVGAAQLVSGLLLAGRAPSPLVAAIAAGNSAVVLVYVSSRTTGVPVGPQHGSHELEPSSPLGLAATAAEVLLVASLLTHLPSRSRRIGMDLLLLCGLGLWVLQAVARLG
jgi:manganese oxidase